MEAKAKLGLSEKLVKDCSAGNREFIKVHEIGVGLNRNSACYCSQESATTEDIDKFLNPST